jgi:hypothetical protein
MQDYVVGDVVTPTAYYMSAERGKPYVVTDTMKGSGQLIRISAEGGNSTYYENETIWYKAKNFRYHYSNSTKKKDTTNTKQFVIVCRMDLVAEYEGTGPEYSALFNSIKEAQDYCRQQLENDPELVYGIFPLQFIALVEKPPVKFKNVMSK